MTTHLNEIEIFDYVNNNRDKLSKLHQAHLDECDYCQQLIRDQKEVNSILSKMKSLKTPADIYNLVSKKINAKQGSKRDWLFYITLGTLAIVAMLLFFDFGGSKMQSKSNRPEQVKDFIQDKMSIDNLNIEENTEQLYQKFTGIFKAFGRSTYGGTILFVLCVVLFYIFVDQQFLRKKIHH